LIISNNLLYTVLKYGPEIITSKLYMKNVKLYHNVIVNIQR